MLLDLLFLCTFALASVLEPPAVPTLSLSNGVFIGSTNNENQYEIYLGVPYAQPPVGNLRFRKARSALPSSATRNATVPPKTCIQTSSVGDNDSEDCLIMNIYRPINSTNSSLPILVWVHGGSWQVGSATGASWDMIKRAKADGRPFIHVGIQYRLNAFGLLASEGMDKDDLNAALSDQSEALRFVKRNARRMGGDPEKIILGGQSAGANGVAILWVYSDPAERLFRGVIMDSGGPLQYPFNDVKDYDGPAGPTGNLTVLAGCGRTTLRKSIDCLRALPLAALRNATSAILARSISEPHYTAWPPALDGHFITQHASVAMRAGRFNRVPVLSGRNRDEGTVFTPVTVSAPAEIRSLVTSVLLPESALPDGVFEEMLLQYPDDPALGSPFGTGTETFGRSPEWKRAAAVFGDWKYTTTSRHTLRTAASYGVQAWGYLWIPPATEGFGAAHGTDTSMVFRADDPPQNVSVPAIALQRAYIRFISDLHPANDDGTQWTNYGDAPAIVRLDANATYVQLDVYREAGINWFMDHLDTWKK